MANGLLRTRDGSRAEVTSVELFFDLVFVITVSQISHALLGHLTWLGAVQAGIMLLAVWWAWIDTAWITNWLDPQHPLVRLLLFVLMAIGIVLSSSLPEAFGERGLAFAVAFVVFQLGRNAFILWVVRGNGPLFRNFLRTGIWYSGSGILWLAGGFAEGDARLWFWLAAVAMDCVSPSLGFWVPGLGRSDTRDWTVEGEHIAERSGLFVMIALGESVLATGVGFTELAWTPEVIAAMAVSLVGSIAMWTIYFGQHASMAAHAIAHSPDPGRIARQAYTYAPILLVAGIIVSAVGDELVLAHPAGHMEPATALVLIGAPALFLLGAIVFKFSVFRIWSVGRLLGLAACLLLVAVWDRLTPLQLSGATTLILAVVAAYEMLVPMRLPQGAPASAAQ